MNYLTINGKPVDSATLAQATAIFTGIGLVVALAIFVLLVVAYWKMFTKAGEKGWKSIIPIYNIYVAFRLAWKDGTKNFLIYLIACIVTCIPAASISMSTGTTTTTATGAGNPVLAALGGVAAIVALVWEIRFVIKQAHSYNKGTGCGILALFFPNIMTLYYGFASTATYQGPQD